MHDNRTAAIQAGLSTFDGDECRKHPHHGHLRYTANGACVKCVVERSRQQTKVIREARLKRRGDQHGR
jgi:hypothetical protein